ncbi:PD-(D/E)XK nuclease family protein, partial [Roseibium algae]
MKKIKTRSIEPETLHFVARLGRTVRSAFDADTLIRYELLRRHSLHAILPKLSRLAQNQVPITGESLNVIYGLSRDHHSFDAPTLDWGFNLTEPQATKTIAHLLNKGSGDVLALRIIAFLSAMKSPYVPTIGEARSAVVEAEVNRIDLVLKYQKEGSDKYSAVIIEAKFGHKITRGQLSKYTKIIKRDKSVDMASTEWVILGIDDNAMNGLKGRQWNKWRFVSWRGLWLRFEKARPIEDDPNLTIFLQWLWH